MGTYRKEWNCCGSVTETEAWEPEVCPFCDITEVQAAIAAERERCATLCDELDNNENSADYRNAARWAAIRIRA